VNRLSFLVLQFKLSLHFEICLPFSFDPLLLHITDYTSMHSLQNVSELLSPISVARELTAFSAVCAQCTNATIPAVPMSVLARVILEAVDISNACRSKSVQSFGSKESEDVTRKKALHAKAEMKLGLIGASA
jgi:hypothetical protein